MNLEVIAILVSAGSVVANMGALFYWGGRITATLEALDYRLRLIEREE